MKKRMSDSLTNEERIIVKRLEYEALRALSIDQIKFYKREMDQLYLEAKRREELTHQING
ncbi:hypothetical protein [Bacillus alveayuensis]|uniref:hypothetical protein n=1 Tax=Aeribacillus alveayuensis TaxID=279215 RepID=UPI0005D0F06F|nr:hypothetical protein [Bacillus alveayuensis]